MTTMRTTPEVGRLELNGHRVTFRTIPARLHAWLRRIHRWIAYANVEHQGSSLSVLR
jgi:hypothetical protein